MMNFKSVYFTLLGLLVLNLFNSVKAQQWNGENNPNESIWRNGNVGIGIDNPNRPFHLRGSNTVLQIDRDTKDPGFGVTRYSPGFGEVWKSFFFYTEGSGPNQGRFIIADWGTKVSGLSTPRLVIDNVGSMGIGTLNPTEKLEVDGRTLSGNTKIGPWPAEPNEYAFFGHQALDHSIDDNYALLQHMSGRTFINSPRDIFFRINNETDMYIANSGRVGIGTTSPGELLDVAGRVNSGNATLGPWPAEPNEYAFFGHSALDHSSELNYALLQQNTGRTFLNSPRDLLFRVNNLTHMCVANTGNVGIGTLTPQTRFHVAGDFTTDWGVAFQHFQEEWGENSHRTWLRKSWAEHLGDYLTLVATGNQDNSQSTSIILSEDQGVLFGSGHNDADQLSIEWMRIATNGNMIIHGMNLQHDGANFCLGTNDGREIGENPLQRALVHEDNDELVVNFQGDFEGGVFVDGAGLKTRVVTILGGSDIAEPFEITAEEEAVVEPGAIVVINENEPGKLKISQTAYDQKVVGIISGANGVNPGMVLSQEDVLGGGENVAISGRVYVKANASNGTIQPGDFLTSSDIKGEAMKASDLDRARGAIIGKAMTSLEQGEGYVLVFISLQ